MERFFTSASMGARCSGVICQAEFFGLEIDTVQAALFSQHDVAVCIYQIGRIRFDGFGEMKLGGDGAALAGEEISSDQRLPGVERVAGKLGH